nr:hypothetical protein [Entomoneis sp.]UZC30225.1 hypothetical protein [Entomoneis sp.]
MLVIKFNFFEKRVTWFLSDNAVFMSSYFITIAILLLIYSIYLIFTISRRKLVSNKNATKSIRGGANELPSADELIYCAFEGNEPKLIHNKNVIAAIRQILGINRSRKFIFIDRVVYLLAVFRCVSLSEVFHYGGTLGLWAYADNLIKTKLAATTGAGLAVMTSALAFFLTQHLGWFLSLTLGGGTLAVVPIIVNLFLRYNIYSFSSTCSKIVAAIAYHETAQERLYYIDCSADKTDKIILQTDPNQNFYEKMYLDSSDKSNCQIEKITNSELQFADYSGEELVVKDVNYYKEKCSVMESNYYPIDTDCHTLADVQIGDSTDQLKKADGYLKPVHPEKVQLQSRLKLQSSIKPKSKVAEMNQKYGSLSSRTKTLSDLSKETESNTKTLSDSYNKETESQSFEQIAEILELDNFDMQN